MRLVSSFFSCAGSEPTRPGMNSSQRTFDLFMCVGIVFFDRFNYLLHPGGWFSKGFCNLSLVAVVCSEANPGCAPSPFLRWCIPHSGGWILKMVACGAFS